MGEVIATLYNYKVGLTSELNVDQVSRLGEFLNKLALENGDRLTTGVVWGLIGSEALTDFQPIIQGSTNG